MANVDRKLAARADRAFARMQSAASKHQELAEFCAPQFSNVTRMGSEGSKKTDRLYHSKGLTAPDKLARSMHGTVTSPAQKWFALKMRDSSLNDAKTIGDWLEECADRMYLAINQSNFSASAGEFYLAFVVFGTAAMLCEESAIDRSGTFSGLRFTALPIGSYAIEPGLEGRVETVFRRFELSREAAFEQWGEDIGMDEVSKLAEKPDELLTILHAVTKRAVRDPRRSDPQNREWQSCYWFEKTHHKIREGGYTEFPYMVARWATAQGEVWGTGPGHLALPDIRTLNRIRELKLQAGGKAVDPPLLAMSEAILSSIVMDPAAINIVDQSIKDPGLALQAFDGKARFDVASLLEENVEKAIGEIFYELELLLQDRPNMTATEVTARLEEKQRLLGPTMGRLQAEFLNGLIERVFALMLRAGALPMPPEALLAAGIEADIDVEYEGPLARAQRSADLVAIDRVNMYTAGLVQATGDTGLWDNFDLDDQIRHYSEIAGQPANLVRDAAQRDQMREQRAQAAAQREQAAMIAEGAKAAGAGAPFLKELREAGTPQPAGAAA